MKIPHGIEKERYEGVPKAQTHFAGGVVAALDQSLLSLSNFAASAIFIRLSSQEEYGLYVALSSIMLLFSGVQNAIVNSPMTVLLPRLPLEEKNSFVFSLFVGQFVSLLFLFILSLPLFPSILRITLNTQVTLSVGIIFGFTILTFLSRDFLRSFFYLSFEPLFALMLDSIFAASMLILFVSLAVARTVTAESGIMMVGIAALVACGMMIRKTSLLSHPEFDFRNAFSKSWQYSKWALAGVFASWLQQNTFIYLASMSSGASSVAQIAAARLFMVPFSLIVAGWGNYVRPIMSQVAESEGKERVLLLLRNGATVLTFLIISYTVVLYLLFPWISRTFLPESYHGIELYLVFWGGISLVEVFGTNLSVAMQSLLMFRDLFMIGVVGMLASIMLGALLAHSYGPIGFLIGVVSSNIAVAVLCYLKVKN